MKISVLTFEKWQKRNPDIMDTFEDCDECNGSGLCECSCGDEHDCGYCEGTGKVLKVTARLLYECQVIRDRTKLVAWTGEKVLSAPKLPSPR